MPRQTSYPLQAISEFLEAQLQGDGGCLISGLATLEEAMPGQLSFFSNTRYLDQLKTTQASAVLVSPACQAYAPCHALVVPDPYLAYARISRWFDPVPDPVPGIAGSAVVDSGAQVAASAQICANVVIGAGSQIGEAVYIGPNSVIGRNCCIADNVRINGNVTLYDDISVGEHTLIHSGAVLGADGFGFANDRGRWVKIAQLGGVSVGAHVEIGAGTTIDRGALSDTRIEDGVKLDNQIQIAHNVKIGQDTAIAGCTAVAGSTKIGARCTIAGVSGIAGHLDIAEGTHITAMSLVSKSIKKAGVYSSGTGLMPSRQWKRSVVRFRQLDELAKRIRFLEEQLETPKG
ncbi:MAG: UDP-3-O-(3-hydroxymyristoyl)glucosamine N-acyltransferase [Pontibacterium sp.]